MSRADDIEGALRRIAPKACEADLSLALDRALASRGLRQASPEAAAWLSLVSLARHAFSDYDALLADGYDRESARHFSLPAINEQLARWGCSLRAGEREADGED